MSTASPSERPRTPGEVIDLAIAENKRWDWLCFGLVIAFATVGLVAIGYGAATNQQWTTIGGSVASVIFWPTLYYALGVWRSNTALRVLEASLSDPKEAKETFAALRAVYLARHAKGKTQ